MADARKLKPHHPQGDSVPDESGYLIVRLKPGAIKNDLDDLAPAARKAKLNGLARCLGSFKLGGKRLIRSVKPAKLKELERTPYETAAPKHSLSAYWRLDARQLEAPLDEVETSLRHLPEVDLVYREKTATDPVDASDDTHAALEGFLNPAPAGVDARWAWSLPGGDGAGMHFVDLEQGWLRGHEDLPPYDLLCGENRDGSGTYAGHHGAAVLGVVAGTDNAKGVIGIAPGASVRVSSHWDGAASLHVADALMAAVAASPRPHVVLIEVQVGANPRLPAETDPATFTAIRCASAHGIIVVEAAGNGRANLDAWADAAGKHRLDRESEDFMDSGAILVGAGLSALPHNRWFWSNFGSRVDCYAWGDSIVSAGFGDLAGAGSTSYTRVFDATSGASAIIAGCVLQLQGLYLASTGSLLRPKKLRTLLSNPSTGTRQGPDRAGHIGVMPDLRQIAERVLKRTRRSAA